METSAHAVINLLRKMRVTHRLNCASLPQLLTSCATSMVQKVSFFFEKNFWKIFLKRVTTWENLRLDTAMKLQSS